MGPGPRRYVVVTPHGKPDCRLCRGMGVRGRANHFGRQRPCKCVGPAEVEAAQAFVDQNNRAHDLLAQVRVDRVAPSKSGAAAAKL